MSDEMTCMWTCLGGKRAEGQHRRDIDECKERSHLMLSTAWNPMLMGQTHPCFFIISSSIIACMVDLSLALVSLCDSRPSSP
jgi:hypothetical protein